MQDWADVVGTKAVFLFAQLSPYNIKRFIIEKMYLGRLESFPRQVLGVVPLATSLVCLAA